MCVFFAVVHAALVPAALVLAKLEAHRAGARVGVAAALRPRARRLSQRPATNMAWRGRRAENELPRSGCEMDVVRGGS